MLIHTHVSKPTRKQPSSAPYSAVIYRYAPTRNLKYSTWSVSLNKVGGLIRLSLDQNTLKVEEWFELTTFQMFNILTDGIIRARQAERESVRARGESSREVSERERE